ncbi:hypothetical protein [Pontibacter harenae]|uniref:hypothetical protein n=1 Tax=Pontibacter harenae TaxID=2894083 RepID=UPI001E28FD26|nr:hypothetical protein [Pontibacter harenae]MCC9168956.1 hypothetical protein [Pontibacter harenae]
MKKSFILPAFILVCASSFTLSAQQLAPSVDDLTPSITRQASIPDSRPLLLVNNQETSRNALIIDDANLKVDAILKDAEATEKYGNKAEGGVVLASTAGNIQLVSLEQVLDYFKVPASQRNLKVLVDGAMVKPELILADISQIGKVEAGPQDVTAPHRYSLNENERYLHIITKK